MNHPRHITIYGNTSQQGRIADINLFLRHLRASGASIEIWREFDDYMTRLGSPTGLAPVDYPSASSDMVLTLGGDGTLLHALSWCGDRRIPLLGVNTGHLGFLTAYTLSESHLLLADMRNERLVGEERILLQLVCPESEGTGIPADIWPYALNEIALLKADTSSMINVCAYTDGHYLTDYRADGLIVSTPTGSTGYNLSAGGPIITPTLDCLLLTPIAAHTLSVRPMVVGADSHIRLLTDSRAGIYRVSLDGRSFTMPSGTTLEVQTAREPVIVVRRKDIDFATTLHTKLHWGHAKL